MKKITDVAAGASASEPAGEQPKQGFSGYKTEPEMLSALEKSHLHFIQSNNLSIDDREVLDEMWAVIQKAKQGVSVNAQGFSRVSALLPTQTYKPASFPSEVHRIRCITKQRYNYVHDRWENVDEKGNTYEFDFNHHTITIN